MNEYDIKLNEDERDCLQELMNISFASATAAIAKIIDKFATLGIPRIDIVSANQLRTRLIENLKSHDAYYISSQLVNGEISGENLFILDSDSSKNLAAEFDLEEDEVNEDEIKDIILEITNILSSTTSAKLADLISSSVTFSAPTVTYISNINEYDTYFTCNYENIIVISTELNFEDQQINGELVIMTKKESSIYLKQALQTILDEY